MRALDGDTKARQQGSQFVHVDSCGGVESMTTQDVADRLRKVGTEGGVVMLVWHNKVDTRTFLKDDRKSPQGEEPAEKRTKATPPRWRRRSEEPGRRGPRGLGRGAGKRLQRQDDSERETRSEGSGGAQVADKRDGGGVLGTFIRQRRARRALTARYAWRKALRLPPTPTPALGFPSLSPWFLL